MHAAFPLTSPTRRTNFNLSVYLIARLERCCVDVRASQASFRSGTRAAQLPVTLCTCPAGTAPRIQMARAGVTRLSQKIRDHSIKRGQVFARVASVIQTFRWIEITGHWCVLLLIGISNVTHSAGSVQSEL